MYRISENKQKIFLKLKNNEENSLDCNLNEKILSFKDINKNIITSDKSFNGTKLIKYDIEINHLLDYVIMENVILSVLLKLILILSMIVHLIKKYNMKYIMKKYCRIF